MAALKWSAKDPADIRDYWIDWGSDALPAAERFLPTNVDIVDATVTIPTEDAQPDPPVGSTYDYLSNVSESFTTKTQRVRLSGGIAKMFYNIDFSITCDDGQVFELTKKLQVEERTK